VDSIADSSSFRDDARVLVQHQFALALLQERLADPNVRVLRWLDLACGRGQLLAGVRYGLSENARSKIDYFGYDIRHDYVQQADGLAGKLGLHSHLCQVGALAHFPTIYDGSRHFDFISLTNTVHEVQPAQLSSILIEALARLTDAGCLFMYDMETIQPFELGAVPWNTGEVRQILNSLLSGLGRSDYEPVVGPWPHRSCCGWSAQIHRQHLGISDAQILKLRTHAVEQASNKVTALLRAKLASCKDALDQLTTHPPEVGAEENAREKLLYEFWAVSRALENSK
jgi:SAM-dependent methyltransferase